MAAVLDAATDLFGRQGPVATSVRDLAKAAGVNHALIFRHFGSKEGLLRSVMDRQVQIVVPRAREITSTRDDLYHLARACRTESRYAWLIGRAVLDGYDPGSFRSSFPVVGHLRQVLRREVAEGGASSSRVLDPDHALAGVLALALGSVIFERYLRAATGLDDSVDFDAVVADCGQALFDLAR
ncbi:MAG: TetR/AcrR family transcriptional regulator [Acidimicrobiia bacterium]|nr:TetR/AcrR family transcriptional regulator [Acidimicrobiia bacterium]